MPTRRLLARLAFVLFLLAAPAILAAQEKPAATTDQQKRFTMDDCVNQFNPARIESTAAGYRYWFVDKDFLGGRTVKLSVVRPHEATHAPHRHAEDEIFFILEGKAEVYLNGEWREIHPYASFYCPPDSAHGIRNPGDTELKYLVMKEK